MSYNRCSICGRFFGFQEWAAGEIEMYYEPDCEFSPELVEYWHKKCEEPDEINSTY